MSIESLKLPKQIISTLQEIGFTEAKEIQAKTLSRINGGQDMILIGPDGCGKSTLLAFSVFSKLKYAFEVAPRALILVPTREKGQELETYFRDFGAELDLRVYGIYKNVDIEDQRELLREGADVIIGTADRILEIYIRSGINLTKLKLFIVDDCEDIIKQNQSVVIKNIADNLNKCQFLLTSTQITDKLNKLGGYFLINPMTVEV